MVDLTAHTDNSQNLYSSHIEIIHPQTDLTLREPVQADEQHPYSSMQALGRWAKEVFDYRNYLAATEKLGEQAAVYKNAYDEGKMGEFDLQKFSKETLKSGLRHLGHDSLHQIGSLTKMIGENVKAHKYMTTMASGGLALMPELSDNLIKIGETLQGVSDDYAHLDWLQPDDDIYAENPTWTQLADLLGQSSTQIATMGMLSKYIGAKSTYGLFALGGASEMFDEAKNHQAPTDTANVSALLNGGTTYAIDRLLSPLPKQIEQRAKMTSHEIAEEILKAPVREATSEVWQQLSAENMVRKAGFDDTQDLFEGLIESALGAFAGSGVLSGVDGTVYQASKSYEKARRRLLLKGVTEQDLTLAEKDMQALLKQHPEAFEKVLRVGLEDNLKLMQAEALQNKDKQQKKAVKDLKSLYKTMYKKAQESLDNPQEARLAAAVMQAQAYTGYLMDKDFEIKPLEAHLPTLKAESSEDFVKTHPSKKNVAFQFGGIKAKGAKLDMLSYAKRMEEYQADPKVIWRETGWHRGDDGMMRFEISDEKAKLNLWTPRKIDDYALQYYDQNIFSLEKMLDDCVKNLMVAPPNLEPYLTEYNQFVEDYLFQEEKKHDLVKPQTELSQQPTKAEIQTQIDQRLEAQVQQENLFKEELQNSYHTEINFKRAEEYMKILQMQHDYYGKTREFSEEDWKMVRALEKRADFMHYKIRHKYPNKNFHIEFMRLFKGATELAIEHPELNQKLMDFITEHSLLRDHYEGMLHKNIKSADKYFYNDFWLEQAFRLDQMIKGKDTNTVDRDFVNSEYQKAYEQKTLSEMFLQQKFFPKMDQAEIDALAVYLDLEEQAIILNHYLEQMKANRTEMAKLVKAKQPVFFDQLTEDDGLFWQKKFMVRNGETYPLEDLLDHEEVYRHYPELRQAQVQFKKLKDNQSYHFYNDENGGFVLEVDADQLDYTDLKETLLSGVQFAIQSIEDFDFKLTDQEMDNFMDFSVDRAKLMMSSWSKVKIKQFLREYLPTEKVQDYLKVSVYNPKNLALYESLAEEETLVKSESAEMPNDKILMITEPDFEKINQKMVDYYRSMKTPDELNFRNFAMKQLSLLKKYYFNEMLAAARANSQIPLPQLKWTKYSNFGSLENRARLERENWTDEMRRKPYWIDTEPHQYIFGRLDENGREEIGEILWKNTEQEMQKLPHFTMSDVPEYLERYYRDDKTYDETITEFAKGAYDMADQTISLFKNHDAETILHEMFHYFNDYVMKYNVRKNTKINEIYRHAYLEKSREFLDKYWILEENGKFIVKNQFSGEKDPRFQDYDSAQEALNAGMEELLVEELMLILNHKNAYRKNSNVKVIHDFYKKWMKEIVKNLEITSAESGEGGKMILNFIRKK